MEDRGGDPCYCGRSLKFSDCVCDTIKFTHEMIECIINGRKTETRRPIKGQPKYDIGYKYCIQGTNTIILFESVIAHKLQDMSYDRGDYWDEGIIPRHDRNCEIKQFVDIWDEIYGDTQYCWRNNPFVYAYRFEVVK